MMDIKGEIGERRRKPVVGMTTRFTFIGKVVQALGGQTVRLRIEAYDRFLPLKPDVNEVNVWLSNLESSKTADDLRGVELEVCIGCFPFHADDIVHGVFRQISQVEKFIAEDSWQPAFELRMAKKYSKQPDCI